VLRLYEGLLTTDILLTLASRLRPYEKCTGITNRRLSELLEDLTRTVSEKESLSGFLGRATAELMFLPRMGDPGMRPIVGVTGDLYTRMNAIGNAGLYQRLEQMGCEVWSSPFFAGMADLSAELAARRNIERAQVKEAAAEGFAAVLLRYSRTKLLSSLPSDIRSLAIEPSARELIQLARPFVGPRTDFLIVQCVAKIADFLGRGAAGVINAAGINCIVGTATASVIPSIRTAFGQAPVITLVYGNSEGPTQRIQLETFVHQVQRRWKSAAA
jgi:predicted nucleotide-binding protein (sugar kinase/HSP70/actin superfamily)